MKLFHAVFFVSIFVITAAAAGQSKTVQRTAAEKKAIAAIKKLGGKIKYDEKNPARHVIHVDFYGTKVTDADLIALKGLPQLDFLRLCYTQITDAGLVHLKGLKNLRVLDLGHTKITDAGLVHLRGFTNLRILWIENTKATNAGAKKLHAVLPKCEFFMVYRSKEELKAIAAIKKVGGYVAYAKSEPSVFVDRVHLTGDFITDGLLVHLKQFPQLQHLRISGSKVTDAGLLHLKGLKNLQAISLKNNPITGTGLVHLRNLTKLQSLHLSSPEYTVSELVKVVKPKARRAFKVGMPGVPIRNLGYKRIQRNSLSLIPV